MKIFLILLTPLIILTACAGETTTDPIEFTTVDLSAKGAIGAIDHSNPQTVVQAIFDSARTRDLSQLSGLCDPQGKNDERTERICDLLDIDRMLFIMEFENGKILGDSLVKGDIAKVPYAYGLYGSDEQVMELVRRENQWYLYRFFSE